VQAHGWSYCIISLVLFVLFQTLYQRCLYANMYLPAAKTGPLLKNVGDGGSKRCCCSNSFTRTLMPTSRSITCGVFLVLGNYDLAIKQQTAQLLIRCLTSILNTSISMTATTLSNFICFMEKTAVSWVFTSHRNTLYQNLDPTSWIPGSVSRKIFLICSQVKKRKTWKVGAEFQTVGRMRVRVPIERNTFWPTARDIKKITKRMEKGKHWCDIVNHYGSSPDRYTKKSPANLTRKWTTQKLSLIMSLLSQNHLRR
jgi:hypothetical protein